MLSWNRPELIERTIKSYFNTISIPHDLIVLDNNSNKETQSVLKKLEKQYNFKLVLLEENKGGKAFNLFLDNIEDYDFVHFSENDLEYLPGWDLEMLLKFTIFPGLGQLSPYSPIPQTDSGEIWYQKPGEYITKDDYALYLTPANVGTTSLVRSKLITQGLKWENLSKSKLLFPADYNFSQAVKNLGWQVAWNDKYLAKNWGHNIEQFKKNIEYYLENYKIKENFASRGGLKNRLKKHGYDLVKSNGKYKIIEDK